MLTFTIILAIAFTIQIFFCRNSVERPRFVTAQTIILNLFWIFLVIYYIDITVKYNADESNEGDTMLQNFYSSTGDLFFILHDWLFISQYLQASLTLPIFIEFFDKEGKEIEARRKKERANFISKIF